MEEESSRIASEGESDAAGVSFSSVTAVATGWTFDFLFVSLCRYFKEENLDEFNQLIQIFESFCDCPSLNKSIYREKKTICAFLCRVLHGEQLDAIFEDDKSIMPLMSAAMMWQHLDRTVADEGLFKNIRNMLLVQSVVVPLKKGQGQSASFALKWFQKNQDCSKNVQAKLSEIVDQNDTCNSFMTSFSFDRLLKRIKCFVDAYLEKNPSNFLLKAATKVAQKIPPTETTSTSEKTKRKLLSTNLSNTWNQDSFKEVSVSIKRLHKDDLPQVQDDASDDNSFVPKIKKQRKIWTPELDSLLKAGVKRHGVGKWGRILLDDDFEGRTGTMLKDRWRILVKAKDNN